MVVMKFLNKKQTADFGQVVIFIDGRLEVKPIEEESEGRIKLDNMVLPLTECKEYFSRTGERYLVFNLSLPAVVEAEELCKIRETEVLKGLFDTPEDKKLSDYIPMILMFLVTFFVIIIRK